MLHILSMAVKGFGEQIREIRERKGFALSKVEAQSNGGITGSYVNQIENGQKSADDISLGKLLGLAKGLQMPIEELLTIALDKEFGKSLPITQKLNSLLFSTENWTINEKEFFFKSIQVFVAGVGASHFRPKEYFQIDDDNLLLVSRNSSRQMLSEEMPVTVEKDEGEILDEKAVKTRQRKTK